MDKVPTSDLRDECKKAIETLEFWLRRLIDDKLVEVHGENYLAIEGVVNGQIRGSIQQNYDRNPSRYPRTIDAALLDDEIKIVCNPQLYEKHFRSALEMAFYGESGNSNPNILRNLLSRLIEPRNCLYHANAISIKDATRVLCYSSDIVDSIKHYYQQISMGAEFPVPLILKGTDHFSNSVVRSNSEHGLTLNARNNNGQALYPGDKVRLEIEVDSSFNVESYDINWNVNGLPIARVGNEHNLLENSTVLVFQVQEKDVGVHLKLSASIVVKNQSWHRLGGIDDGIAFNYKVLPVKR